MRVGGAGAGGGGERRRRGGWRGPGGGGAGTDGGTVAGDARASLDTDAALRPVAGTPLRDAVRHAMNGYNNQTAILAACPEGASWCETLRAAGSAHVANGCGSAIRPPAAR